MPTDSEDPNSGGTSRRTVIAACEASLRRLRTDYIDVYDIHRPYTQTAIDETLRALDDLVRAGKIRYVGSSGASGWQLMDMLWCAHDLGLARPVVEQTAYHLLDRRAERDLVPAAITHDTALTVWSPLAGGLLTGKYVRQGRAGKARLAPDDEWGAKHFTPAGRHRRREVGRVRRAHREHPCCAQLGLGVAAARDHQSHHRAAIDRPARRAAGCVRATGRTRGI